MLGEGWMETEGRCWLEGYTMGRGGEEVLVSRLHYGKAVG